MKSKEKWFQAKNVHGFAVRAIKESGEGKEVPRKQTGLAMVVCRKS